MSVTVLPEAITVQTLAGHDRFAPSTSGRFGEIREHAVRLFALKGFGSVSMRDLAASVGLTAGSLYNHVESKEALLLEFVEELYEVLCASGKRTIKTLPTSGYLRALIGQHLALHESMAAHFVLAETEARYLSEEHRRRAGAARHRYARLYVVHCAADTAMGLSIVALLNSAPAWLFGLSQDAVKRVDLAFHVVRELHLADLPSK